jgi:hypothetical protein
MAYPRYLIQRARELSPGRSAREILRVLNKEFPNDDLPNERTIRRWCDDPPPNNDEEEQDKTSSDVSEKLIEHNERLASVVDGLLSNELKRVMKWVSPTGQVEYRLCDESGANLVKRLTEDELINKFSENINLVYRHYEEWFFKTCFLPHLYAEWSDELKNTGFNIVVEKQFYQLIETLRLLAERKTFNGICPMCKDWV